MACPVPGQAVRLVATSANPWDSNKKAVSNADGLRVIRKGAGEPKDNQTFLNTKVPLVPPKPKLFFTATLMGIWRAVLAQ